MMHIQYFENSDAVALATMKAVVSAANEAIAQRGVFHWVLAGGTTPKQAYILLRKADIDWAHVHVWFGDERCLPIGDVERNDVMADQALLQHVAIPSVQVHRIQAELGADTAAANYTKALQQQPNMDLILLGMGEDGHTASLFPDHPALSDARLAVPVFNAPKPPSNRVSMGYSTLKAGRQRIIMVAGEGKREAFMQACQGEPLPVNIANSIWYSALS